MTFLLPNQQSQSTEGKSNRLNNKLLNELLVQSKFSQFKFIISCIAFSALTLLVGHQEGHPACKNLE